MQKRNELKLIQKIFYGNILLKISKNVMCFFSKSTEEASEARIRLQEVELALMNVEEQNNFIREQFQESERAMEAQKYEYDKLHSDYEIVCQELEIARAANQHLVLTAKKEKEAAIAAQNTIECVDNTNDLMTVMEDVIPPAPAPPTKGFENIGIQVCTEELVPILEKSEFKKTIVPYFH